MRTYDKYKPSGIDWIGDIPEHWKLKKLKYLIELVDKTISDTSLLIAVENIESKTGKLVNLDGDKTFQGVINEFQKGDVLFNKLRPCLAKVYYAEQNGGYVGELLNFRSGGELHGKFLYYRVSSANFIDVVDSSTTGTKMPRASWEDFISHLLVAFPPLPEQTAIADYLDDKTAQIDSLISNKLRLIELLKEERTAIINQAVTRGISPHATLKPSGIAWLGDIPEHWEVKKLKYLADMQGGFAFNSNDFVPQGIQLIKIGNLYQNEFLLNRQATYLPEGFLDEHKEWNVKDGDILISMTGTLGKRDYGYAIQVKNDGEQFLLNQRVSRIRFIEAELLKELGLHILRSHYYQDQLFLLPTGTKQGNRGWIQTKKSSRRLWRTQNLRKTLRNG